MKNLIKTLESGKMNINGTINAVDITTKRYSREYQFSGVLACRYEHLQILKNLGVIFDFSNKRVGMQPIQKSLFGTGNNVSISVKCNLETLKKIHPFFRSEMSLNMNNNHNLERGGFFINRKIKTYTPSADSHFEKLQELQHKARVFKQNNKLSQIGYGY